MKRLLLLFLFLSLLADPAWGATYYLRGDGTVLAADKANATGCGAASTAMNLTQHNAATFAAGDIVVLCDTGGVFRSAGLIPPSSGTEGNPIAYTASGSPVIDGADLDDKVTGWAGPDGNGEYSKTYTTEPKIVIGNEVLLAKGTVGSLDDTQWVYSGGKLYLGQAPSVYSTLRVAQRDYCIGVNGRSYIDFTNISVSGNNKNGAIYIYNGASFINLVSSGDYAFTVSKVFDSGIHIYGGNNIMIDGVKVEYVYNSSDGFGIAIRANASLEAATNVTVKNSMVTDGLTAHGIYVNGLTGGYFYNNTVYRLRGECSAGITISNIVADRNTVTGRLAMGREPTDDSRTCSNITFSNNNVTNVVGYNYDAIELGSCTGNNYVYGNTATVSVADYRGIALDDRGKGGTYYVYGNTITTVDRGFYVNGGTVFLYNNVATATGTGTTNTDTGIFMAVSGTTALTAKYNVLNGYFYGVLVNLAGSSVNLWNNTIKFTGIGLYVYGVAITGDVRNNIFFAAETPVFYIYENAGPTVIYNNNIYGTSTGTFWRSQGVNKTWATWQAVPNDALSYNTAPLMISASDFRLLPTSPAINAGTVVAGLHDQPGCVDFAGRPCNVGIAPDIGAYESRKVPIRIGNQWVPRHQP